MRLASVLMNKLKSIGIKNIFGVPGRENKYILFNEEPEVKYITTRIEFNAGIMAEFTARLTQMPQACFATMGPGATNMVTAAASAMLNNSPLLIFTSQIESDDLFYNISHQCVNQKKIFEPVTKKSYELENPKEIISVLDDAFEIIMTEPLGPVHISIPVNFYNEEILYVNDITQMAPSIIYSDTEFDLNNINHATHLMSKARKPICIVGQEVIRINAAEEVKQFCITLNIPLLSSANAQGILPADHILNLGTASPYMEGILGFNALENIFSETDLIICIGYQYADDLLPKMWNYGIEKKIIFISRRDLKVIDDKLIPTCKIIDSISDTLNRLTRINTKFELPSNFSLYKSDLDIKYNEQKSENGYLTPIQIMKCVNHFTSDGILITDIGYYRHHIALFARPNKVKSFFTDSGLSSFGSGLPSAAAAKLLYPEKKVILICGDGGFHSGSCDIETITRNKIGIIIIVLNNSSYRLIQLYQKSGQSCNSNYEILNFNKVDFVKLAESNGCQSVLIDNIDDLAFQIENHEGASPLLIEIPFKYPENDHFFESF